MNANKKACIACGKQLSATAFNGSTRTADGLARTCRACTNARRRQRESSGDDPRPQSHAQSTIVATALRQGDIQTVQQLLRAGLAPPWGWVCETMRAGHLPVAELLLKSGVERNVFTMAAMAEVKGLTKTLDRAPAEARLAVTMEPASTRVTPLHVGCASDWRLQGRNQLTAQVQVARVLHEHEAELNALACYRGIANATPLLCACWSSGNLALVRWLLEQGEPATDADLLAALGHLQRHGRGAYDIAETLLAWGLPVDGCIPGARTPLQACAHQADHRAVAWLIAHGADVNARGPGGRTAAHFAAERNTGPTTLGLLVESGADLSARDDDGRTPLNIAKLNGKTRLAEWIAKQ